MEEIKQKATEVVGKHLEMLNEISVEDIKKNPVLLMVVTDSIKQSIGLLMILNKL